MQCPKCESNQVRKNGHRRGRQAYICKQCRRQFLASYLPQGYSNEVKQLCLKMYVNGMGFRAIERVTDINHNTIINWVKQVAQNLPDAPQTQEIPEITQVDERFWEELFPPKLSHELQTFVQSKKKIRSGYGVQLIIGKLGS